VSRKTGLQEAAAGGPIGKNCPDLVSMRHQSSFLSGNWAIWQARPLALRSSDRHPADSFPAGGRRWQARPLALRSSDRHPVFFAGRAEGRAVFLAGRAQGQAVFLLEVRTALSLTNIPGPGFYRLT